MPITYAELRKQLEENLDDLDQQLTDMQSQVREEGVGYSNHMADAGTEVFEQELDVSLARQLKQSHETVQHALEKFDDGTYGICESCGASIELARLEALPEARYCLDCQSRRETTRGRESRR
jgi:DnaK suppressor protein